MEESELADSDAENKMNPDEYEDDTTEFGQSEVAANDSQNEVSIQLQFVSPLSSDIIVTNIISNTKMK